MICETKLYFQYMICHTKLELNGLCDTKLYVYD